MERSLRTTTLGGKACSNKEAPDATLPLFLRLIREKRPGPIPSQ
jgi:hypothetical protein